MKTVRKILLFLALILLTISGQVIGQVAISSDGSAPNPAAMLEVKSTNKGLLLPRLDFNNRPNPAVAGLLIYVTANGPLGNNALYYYDGTSWIMLASANLVHIGQHIGGGVVFYKDPTGLHGLIATEQDQAVWSVPWGSNTILVGPGAQGSAIGTGQQNTTAILAANPAPGIAARICDTLTINGFTDWFLPSVDELDSMYVQRDTIGGIQDGGWYWSSTEQGIDAAWVGIFYNPPPPIFGWTGKENGLSVRCIRKF